MKKITKNVKLIITSAALVFGSIQINAQERCGETGGVVVKSPRGRTVYEMWQDYGDACFTPHNWDVSGKWSNVGNVLVRESLRRETDSRGRVTQQPTRNTRIDYNITVNNWSGNVYHGAYGWWSKDGAGKDDIVEWYVVDSYRDINNPTYGMTPVGSPYRLGRAYYQIYTRQMRNAPSVFAGSDNFTQVKCVRTTSKDKSARGGMHLRAHFDKIKSIAGISDKTLFEISYKIEGYGACNTCTSKADFRLNATFTSLKEVDEVAGEEALLISPNPTNGAFQVNTSAADAMIHVYTINGQLVKQLQANDSLTTLNESGDLDTGMYIVSVTTNAKTVHKKLVIL